MSTAPHRVSDASDATYARISVEPVTPVIGAEISGVDLSGPLDEQTIAEIRHAIGNGGSSSSAIRI